MKKIYYTFCATFLTWGAFAQSTCETAQVINAGLHHVDTLLGVPHSVTCLTTAATKAEWFIYQPTAHTNVTVTTSLSQNAGGDTRILVYRGNCGNLVCVGGDDDGGDGYLSIYNFLAVAGETYFIVFDNRWNSRGFDFELQTSPYTGPDPNSILTFIQGNSGVTGNYLIAVSDMNGDYLDDVIGLSASSVVIGNQYQNNQFIVSSFPVDIQFLPSWSMAIGDIDRNGYNDMVLGNGNGVSFVYAQDNGFGYRHQAENTYVFSQRTNMLDLNNDGHLDVFVCHDVAPNVHYTNDGTGALTYAQGGIGDHPNGGNYGSIWGDIDNDGLVDLFIAKCRGGASTAKLNQMFKNNGDGTFTEISEQANMNHPNQSWSAAMNDFDGDGFMDFFVGANSMSDGGHLLMMNNGDGTFTDELASTTINSTANGFDEWISFDFDNNGWPDIYGGGQTILLNNGNLSFTAMTLPFTFATIGDLNNDGFLDFSVGPNVYFTQPNENNWLKVNMRGIASNANGIGARVEMYAGGRKQIRDVQSGTGFRRMHTLNVHFGLGEVNEIDSVIVRWPSGTVDVLRDVQPNGALLVVEGNSSLSNVQATLEDVQMYPNPTTGQLTISNLQNHDVVEVQVVSLMGQKVQVKTSEFEKLDLKDLNNGMYIVNIILGNGKSHNELILLNK